MLAVKYGDVMSVEEMKVRWCCLIDLIVVMLVAGAASLPHSPLLRLQLHSTSLLHITLTVIKSNPPSLDPIISLPIVSPFQRVSSHFQYISTRTSDHRSFSTCAHHPLPLIALSLSSSLTHNPSPQEPFEFYSLFHVTFYTSPSTSTTPCSRLYHNPCTSVTSHRLLTLT
jgi:hypothetical protein